MYFAKYLLSIEEFMNMQKGRALMERAFSRVDETRRRKAEGMRQGRAQVACLGAGLLLQLAVGEAIGKKSGERGDGEEEKSVLKKTGGEREERAVLGENGKTISIKQYSVSRLLDCTENMPRLSLNYTYGEKGKPYLKDFPLYFNLSHSGDYVLCGLGSEEIGADIQQHCGKDVRKIAQRFFSEREATVIERAGEAREELFYRLWTRKEAYGKLTGRGIAEVLNVDLLSGDGRIAERGEESQSGYGMPSQETGLPVGSAAPSRETVLPDGRRLLWEECNAEGYSIAFCRYG